MYRHCIFCRAELGQNQIIEAFPTGRRLAFDSVKGRLWVVCQSCNRWNLSPLEERWEAIEQCERLYRDTRTRVATENIGLAHTADGSDLVRIGKPRRPEFAGWRYGTTLRRRRYRSLITGSLLLGGSVGGYLAGSAILGFTGSMILQQGFIFFNALRLGRTAAHVPDDNGHLVPVNRVQLRSAAFHAEGHRWFLRVHHRTGYIDYSEQRAISIAGQVLPYVNHTGATAEQIKHAVRQIEDSLHTDHLFEQVVHNLRAAKADAPRLLIAAPAPVRLALEMAAHEEQERRALEGELADLETLWRQAEEIAAIADNLLIPAPVARLLHRHRRSAPPTT